MKDAGQLAALNASIASGSPDWNLLYPYCQWTNSPGAVSFSLDVPASYMIGSQLEILIRSFDGIEGDNHRLVFFFDN